MNKAWPRVGMRPSPPASGCFCLLPQRGGSMTQALKRVTSVRGKGKKRRKERATGKAKQVVRMMILMFNISMRPTWLC